MNLTKLKPSFFTKTILSFAVGASFGATALFYLGFSMVGRFNAIDRRGVYILVVILIGKV